MSKDPSKNAYNWSINLSGQADTGGKEAVELLRDEFADLLTKLDKKGIPTNGTMQANVAPARETPDGPALGEEVVHDTAADVLLRAKSKEQAKAEAAKEREAHDAAGSKVKTGTVTTDTAKAK